MFFGLSVGVFVGVVGCGVAGGVSVGYSVVVGGVFGAWGVSSVVFLGDEFDELVIGEVLDVVVVGLVFVLEGGE